MIIEFTTMMFTYDDVRLTGGSAGNPRQVALNLESSLIKQVQVVFHWVSIMEALAETNDTCREKTGMVKLDRKVLSL